MKNIRKGEEDEEREREKGKEGGEEGEGGEGGDGVEGGEGWVRMVNAEFYLVLFSYQGIKVELKR